MKRKVIILDAPNFIDLTTAEAELATGGYGTGDLLRVIRNGKRTAKRKGVPFSRLMFAINPWNGQWIYQLSHPSTANQVTILMEKIRVIRHYQENGLNEAKRLYPDHQEFIVKLKGRKLQPMIDDIFNQINLLQDE